ncbi:glycosyltransferase family 4 protein [Aquimarina sp. 2201CG5-10]|uniref:glycosyltransferase family 4 protein n=1 Tax=Aquimarina callyspongiae TaxID=3098150 RepID=UPI002AB41DD8|nr:glycosyltransferase family 4 protein [Aquimarina sp. 2201CG5-10]MDY8136036.1 glycosyltransferase family 4 protein [Aquimarina sp. 2201CG5-10]
MFTKPEYAYIAFDVFPSQKGAATHINHCLRALQGTFKTGILICLGNDDMPTFQFDKERNLYVYRWKEKVINFLERTQRFEKSVLDILQIPLCETIKLIHFRDIWGGIPALKTDLNCKTVFEVNAFSHIELPSRYPNISESVIQKIKNLEHYCITKCDTIITPSNVTKKFIKEHFKIESLKINVIPNGVKYYDLNTLEIKNNPSNPYILYFGALQKWQGIKILFKALKEIDDLDIRLLICASVPEKRTLIYHDLAENFGVNHKIDWLYELDKRTLATKIKNALFTVAPLSSCNRNIIQGCSPLKILESMAYATPVVASDIPVVSELINDNETGYLVPPDRPELLGRKIRILLESPKQLKKVGLNGKKEIEKKYLWDYQEDKMKNTYKALLLND